MLFYSLPLCVTIQSAPDQTADVNSLYQAVVVARENTGEIPAHEAAWQETSHRGTQRVHINNMPGWARGHWDKWLQTVETFINTQSLCTTKAEKCWSSPIINKEPYWLLSTQLHFFCNLSHGNSIVLKMNAPSNMLHMSHVWSLVCERRCALEKDG